MQNEEINPLGTDFISTGADDFLEIAHFVVVQRSTPQNRCLAYSTHFAVDYDDFRTRFASLRFYVDMNRIMFIGIKHDDQAEIFVELGHWIYSCQPGSMEKLTSSSALNSGVVSNFLPVRRAALLSSVCLRPCIAPKRYSLARWSIWMMGIGGSVQYKKVRLRAFNQCLDDRCVLAQDRFDLIGGAIPPPYPYNFGR